MTIEEFQKELKRWDNYVEVTKEWPSPGWHRIAVQQRDAIIRKFFSQIVKSNP